MDPHNSNPYCSRINCTEFFHAQILCTAVYFQYIWYSFIGFSKFSLVFPWISWIFLIGLVAKYFTFSCNDKYFFQYILNWSLLALIFFFFLEPKGLWMAVSSIKARAPGMAQDSGADTWWQHTHTATPPTLSILPGKGGQGHRATMPHLQPLVCTLPLTAGIFKSWWFLHVDLYPLLNLSNSF